MVSPISSFLNTSQIDEARRKSLEDARAKGLGASEVSPNKAQGLADDVLELSAAGQKVADDTGFDQARVDAIRKAIAQNGYPIDARRIAEHFVALERML